MGIMAAAAAPRGRPALSLALTSAGLTGWFAWRLHQARPPGINGGLPLWLELALFALGLIVALVAQGRSRGKTTQPQEHVPAIADAGAAQVLEASGFGQPAREESGQSKQTE